MTSRSERWGQAPVKYKTKTHLTGQALTWDKWKREAGCKTTYELRDNPRIVNCHLCESCPARWPNLYSWYKHLLRSLYLHL